MATVELDCSRPFLELSVPGGGVGLDGIEGREIVGFGELEVAVRWRSGRAGSCWTRRCGGHPVLLCGRSFMLALIDYRVLRHTYF